MPFMEEKKHGQSTFLFGQNKSQNSFDFQTLRTLICLLRKIRRLCSKEPNKVKIWGSKKAERSKAAERKSVRLSLKKPKTKL